MSQRAVKRIESLMFANEELRQSLASEKHAREYADNAYRYMMINYNQCKDENNQLKEKIVDLSKTLHLVTSDNDNLLEDIKSLE